MNFDLTLTFFILVALVLALVNSSFGLQAFAKCEKGLESEEMKRRQQYLAVITGILATTIVGILYVLVQRMRKK
jgi:hypothetical protein